MKRIVAAALIAAASVSPVSPVHAQMAGALGKPLESGDLPPGTVSVRVVAGSPSKPVIGREVTLLVDGNPLVARTGNDGRAVFKDVKLDAQQVQAAVRDDDRKEIKSETFKLPVAGVRIMLSTLPWNPGASGGGAMAGGGAMPDPRQMSGEPRPEQTDAPGTLTVRLSYDDFKDTPPAGVPVALVGYHADDSVDLQIVNSDPEGRAQFKGLDRTGATSYFAMTLLPREGKLDRLTSTPAVLDPRAGVRLILSGEKRTSGAAAVDDLSRFEKQHNAPPAGKVSVTLEGGGQQGTAVSLVELTPTERRVFAQGRAQAGPPDPSEVQAGAQFDADPAVAANTIVIKVRGGANRVSDPLEGVAVMIAPAAAAAERKGQVDGKTGADGSVLIKVDPALKGPFVAALTINGKELVSNPFELASKGGVLTVEAHWASTGKPQVEFDVVPRPGQVFYAEAMMDGQRYRSLPFQPIPQQGTSVSVFIYPRVLFTFSLTSRIDDKYLAVNGRFEVSNNAWAPYVGGPDGLMIPLPKRFIGAILADKDQADVAVVPGEGFRIIRPLPPGSRQFHGGFSLPVDDGTVSWRLDLPFGSFNSGMEILNAPGMRVETPPGVRGDTVTVPQGSFFVLPQISIMPRQSMVMTITGLPQPPAWKVWLPRIFAIVVVLVMAVGLGAALWRRREPTTEDRDARRQALLDELVELDRVPLRADRSGEAGKKAKRREEIMAELEALWGDSPRVTTDNRQPPA